MVAGTANRAQILTAGLSILGIFLLAVRAWCYAQKQASIRHFNKALLIQRGQEPFAGTWQLPGGYVENDELLSLAVEREIEEEAGVTAKVTDVVAFRHMLGGPSSNIYMIFRLDYVAGEPRYDSVETADAGFYSLDEMATMRGVQNISRWGIEQAILTIPGSGLTLDTTGTRMPRWQVFGLTDADPGVWRQH